MSNQITFKSLQTLVAAYNEECKTKKDDERPQEKRRALLEVRRAINGDEPVTGEQLVQIGGIIAKAKRQMAEEYEAIEMDEKALQAIQLADDVEEIVLEITTIEEE